MSDRPGKQAIVVGGSIAGLITARVLSDYFEQVLIIERDEIADQPVIHKSVPQGNHLHALLHGGLQVLSSLYPSFTEDLRRSGATQITVGRDIVWYLPDGKAYSPTGSVRAPFDSGLEAYCASRGLIEFVIRKRTTAIPNIRFESGLAVRDLIYRDCRVRGVRCANARLIEAELVVDATGEATAPGNGLRLSDFRRLVKLRSAWTRLTAPPTSVNPRPSPRNRSYLSPVRRRNSLAEAM
jgi:glycine/D-amino acid oxidase-like deaminating enzyme